MLRPIPVIPAGRWSPSKVKSSASSPACSIRPSSACSSASLSRCRSRMPPAPPASIRSSQRLGSPMEPRDEQVSTLMERILYEVKKTVVGQDHFLERVLVATLAQGHLLVEGVPGLAKTLTVKTLARPVRGGFRRVQFTPHLVPADLVGTRIYNQKSGDFSTSLGPVFCNLLLADEINRAPAKVQSALLEVMQERQVTIAGATHKVPEPFLVMATQNPIETEGTYPLPEAQVDRFMMKILVDYPLHDEEITVVVRSLQPPPELRQVLSLEVLRGLQRIVAGIYVDPGLISYAVGLATATRRAG